MPNRARRCLPTWRKRRVHRHPVAQHANRYSPGMRSAVAFGAICALLLAGCSAGGSSSSPGEPPVAAPTVSLNVRPSRVETGGFATLEWSSANTRTCTASGDWNGIKATQGSQTTGALSGPATFRLTCQGEAGEVAAMAQVDVYRPGESIFPLTIQPSERFLRDVAGRPFLVHGDTAWSLIAQLTREEAQAYLDDRQRRGFNTLLVNLIEHKFASHAPANAYGDAPFLIPGDYASPNDAYFAHANYVIAQAEQRGILVMLTPSYMGFDGGSEGWYAEMAANGAAKLRTYGAYVATQLRNRRNILWVQGGDFNPPDRELLRALAQGIRSVDGQWLHTFHGRRGTAALAFLGDGESWLGLNTIYTDQDDVVPSAFAEYARSTMPFVLIEARYEGEAFNAEIARREAYTAMLSGAAGQLFGNSPIWQFAEGWQQALDSAGSRSMTQLRSLLDSIPWNQLVPDIDGTLLLSGTASGATRAAAAIATDRSVAVIYVPEMRAITVDLARLAGPTVHMRIFDPVTGRYTAVAQSPLPATTGPRTINPPTDASSSDWVLLLDSTQ